MHASVVDHYTTLELARSATAAQIRKAYHRLALLHHPDKQSQSLPPERLFENEERFKEIAYAWEVLGDPEQRALYDAGLSGWGCSAEQRDSRSVFREFFGGGEDGKTQTTAAACGCIVEIKLPEDVFNLPLFEGYLVLDPRPAAARDAAGAPGSGALWQQTQRQPTFLPGFARTQTSSATSENLQLLCWGNREV